jgi:hypothetical protein
MAKTKYSQFGTSRYDGYMKNFVQPIPRHRFAELLETDLKGGSERPGLAQEVSRLFVMRKAQLSATHLMDMRLMRYLDPELMSHHWQSWLTGEPLPKLKTTGLSIELYYWPAAVVEALVGLLAGHKPTPYMTNVLPDDEDNELAVAEAQVTEDWLERERDAQDYAIVYQDLITDFCALGRSVRHVTIDPETRRIRTLAMWPHNFTGFWQEDGRTLEQAIVARNMTVGEAIAMYPGAKDAIERAAFRGNRGSTRRGAEILMTGEQVQMLTCWYRLGTGYRGTAIGMAVILVGDTGADNEELRPEGFALLDYDDDTGYPDIPFRVTPRMRIRDKSPEESFGALRMIAGPVTEFDETVSAYRDMIWRAIYQRYVATGFSFRNAPRLDRTIGGVIPIPRTDQKLQRLDEVINSLPVDQVVNRQEELIIVLPGLNRYFLGSAPPSETSGEAISAAIHASITRLEPQRTNIGHDEVWTYRMWVGLGRRYGEYEVTGGRKIALKSLLVPNPRIDLTWRDIRPREEIRAKQMALAAKQQGIISGDTARDEWLVGSKSGEVRKIRRERQDPFTNPDDVTKWASAIVAAARAKAALANPMGAGPTAPGDAMSAAQGAQPQRVPSFQSDNQEGGAYPPTQEGQAANPIETYGGNG